jgi:hypothetical protein
VVFASRGMVHSTDRSLVCIPFYMCRVNHALQMTVDATAAFSSTVLNRILRRCAALSPVSSSFERHNFIGRSELFHQQLRQHRTIVTAKRNIGSTYCFFRRAR